MEMLYWQGRNRFFLLRFNRTPFLSLLNATNPNALIKGDGLVSLEKKNAAPESPLVPSHQL